MNGRYTKADRLLRHKDYKKIFQNGERLVGSYVIFDYMIQKNSSPKLGITVTKKFGKAHDRNRFKRISREAFRRIGKDYLKNIHINLRPRPFARKAKMQDIVDEIRLFSQKL